MTARALILGLATLASQQATYDTPDHSFSLKGFDEVSYNVAGLHGVVRGAPFTASWNDRGLVMTGRNAVLDAGKDAHDQLYLTSADVSGSATLVQDSQMAYQFQVQRAEATHSTPPPETPGNSHIALASESFTYAGTDTEGTITIPGAFTLNRTAHLVGSTKKNGQTLPFLADDAFEASGSSATISFSAPANDLNSLRKGTMAGPITAHFVRNSTTGGKADPATTVDATSDRLDLDFTGPRHTVTLTGNVKMNGVSGAYSGSATAAKAVIVFGANGNIETVDMTGSPVQTQIKPRPTGAGGGR